MNQSQSMSLAMTTTPTQPKTRRRARPTRLVLASLRARFRAFRFRSTLGPTLGDPVLGDSQWRSNGNDVAA
jgi:hypothetical protein